MTPEQRKRQLQMLTQLEGGTAAIDAAEQPGGTLPTADAVVLEDDLPIAAPPTRRVVTSQVPMPAAPPPAAAAPVDPDAELTAARGADVDAFNDRANETALRQIVAGITRTKAPDSVTPVGTGEKDLLGRRRQATVDALRQMEAGNNAARTDAYVKNNESAAERAAAGGVRADRKLALDETEAGRRDARFEAEQALKQADLERKKAADAAKAKKGSGKAQPARDANGKLIPSNYRDQLRGNAIKPRPGWEPIVDTEPTFRDAQQAKAFDDVVASVGAIKNHRDHVLHEVENLKNAKTASEIDIAMGRLNAQMGALSGKLRIAEGLNNSDAGNEAIEKALSLEHGSAITFKNLANQGRLPAILDAAMSSADANLDTYASSQNIRRSKTAAPGAAAAAAPAQGEAPGFVTLVDETGEELDLAADKVDAMLKAHPKMRRK